jgi:type I restriction enzyme M protein
MDARAAATVEPALETAIKERQRLTADHLLGIEKFEADLWKIADNLRANSNLASNEYFMPIMGLIFLRHATNRFYNGADARFLLRHQSIFLISRGSRCLTL